MSPLIATPNNLVNKTNLKRFVEMELNGEIDSMTTVTLVYPYFHPRRDNSIFRFPPIGLGYIAAYLKQNGISVNLVDCTFLSQEKALERIRASKLRYRNSVNVFDERSIT